MWIWPSSEFTDWKPSLSLYTKTSKCVFVLSSSLVAGYAPKEEALAAKQPHPPPHLLSGGNSWQRPRNLYHPQLHGLPGPTVWLWGECLQDPLTHNACEPTEIRTLVCSCQRKLAYLALIKVLFHLNPSRLIKRRVCRYIFAFVRTGKEKKCFFDVEVLRNWATLCQKFVLPEMSCAAGSESAPSAPQVWLHAPYELHLSLFEHFIELLTESRQVSEGSFPEQETDHMKNKMTFIFLELLIGTIIFILTWKRLTACFADCVE